VTAPTSNESLLAFVEQWREVFEADEVHWCDGSAEEYETEEQAKILRLLRCNEIQGYLISKPVPFDEMTKFLKQSAG
jgi:GTP-dependent phosphoenolpyruvate carboxykinase